jgi:uncharacterized protein (DUF1330 family)
MKRRTVIFYATAFTVLEFPAMEMARAWHSDSDYAPFIKLRRQYSELDLILVEGTPRATTSGKPRLT